MNEDELIQKYKEVYINLMTFGNDFRADQRKARRQLVKTGLSEHAIMEIEREAYREGLQWLQED